MHFSPLPIPPVLTYYADVKCRLAEGCVRIFVAAKEKMNMKVMKKSFESVGILWQV
tara:strand:- start:64 stop:231 length:168 start_codon:yes stop_codon:yes gene_type:complete